MEVSQYYSQLDSIHKERYMEKISCLGIDPYCINIEDCSSDLGLFPKIIYPDIVTYLVHTKSAYTMEEMKAYKSLEAYNQAACGWVKKVAVKEFSSKVLVLGKVMHSQRLREKLLSPWIIASKDGQIHCAHCDCVAGLGEVCTHVSAVMFSIDSILRKMEETTRTGVKAYWMPPSNRPVEPDQIFNIDFAPPAKKISAAETPLFRREAEKLNIPPLTTEERNELLQSLMASSQGSVLHLVTKPFADEIHVEVNLRKKFSIMNLFKQEYQDKSLTELQEIGAQIQLALTQEECDLIEEETRQQSKSKIWFFYRAGRVTASKFKRCCRTKIEKPSISLIKEICYPTTHRYKVRALDYGCKHEKEAIKAFCEEMKKTHINLKVEKCGLIVNKKYPWFGASPDGVIKCDCCGVNIIEIKCPYCVRNSGIEDLINKKSFMRMEAGNLALKEDHEYFFQVQMQMALTEKPFCYFVAWSRSSFAYTKVEFLPEFWKEQSKLATSFFFNVILPEALGKYFTKSESNRDIEEYIYFSDENTYEEVVNDEAFIEIDEDTSTIPISSPKETNPASVEQTRISPEPGPSKPTLYCICRQQDDKLRPMIACDSESCEIEWFHLECVGLKEIPKSQWACDSCSQINSD